MMLLKEYFRGPLKGNGCKLLFFF